MTDSQPPDRPLSIGELADSTGVSRRSVRFYVQRGLIDPPVGLGRASHYTSNHAEQIRRVLALQRGGLRLEDISALPEERRQSALAAESSNVQPAAKVVVRIELTPGVCLEIVAGTSLPTTEQIQKLTEAAKKILSE